METSKGRGLTSHLPVEMQLSRSSRTLRPPGTDSWGRRFSFQPRRREKGYLKLKARVDQGASLTFMLSTDSKLKHQDHSTILVSIY